MVRGFSCPTCPLSVPKRRGRMAHDFWNPGGRYGENAIALYLAQRSSGSGSHPEQRGGGGEGNQTTPQTRTWNQLCPGCWPGGGSPMAAVGYDARAAGAQLEVCTRGCPRHCRQGRGGREKNGTSSDMYRWAYP